MDPLDTSILDLLASHRCRYHRCFHRAAWPCSTARCGRGARGAGAGRARTGDGVLLQIQEHLMSNPYREIFRAAGAKGFAAAGFVARLPVAMAPIGIVAMLSETPGEYWIPGAVSATPSPHNALRS